MRRLIILNPKGGCGKSTIATNLASYFALQGEHVAIADFDPQRSSLDWLAVRPSERPKIHGFAVEDSDELMIPLGSGYLIMDAPAGIHGKEMARLVKKGHTILIPVLPSPIDMRATARFIEELLLVGRVEREKTRIAVLANRVREHTIDGKPADMVAHLVHKADDGSLGVIGVLMNVGKSNKVLAPLWAKMPKKEGEKVALKNTKVDLMALLPANTSYYNYTGSLTTPPCSEGVNWMVMSNRTTVSKEQVKAFTKLFPHSTRPVQPLNDRTINGD